mgnify:CR=1 FL=1
MRNLIDTLAEQRKGIVERGSRFATATRERGVEALGLVRDGTLDWHRTLLARRAALDAGPAQARRLSLDGFQMFVLDRFDRLHGAFAEKVREEIERLGRFELARHEPPELKATPRARPKSVVKARRTHSNAAPKTATRRLVLPIADYDSLSAKAVIAELSGLSRAHCKAIRLHEAANKKRKTVLDALDSRLA